MGIFRKKRDRHEAELSAAVSERTEDRGNDAGDFAGFVLLSEPEWDKEKFLADFKADWGFEIVEDGHCDNPEDDGKLVYGEADGLRITVGIIEGRIPGGEVEHFAGANYMWNDAVEVVSGHKAQLIVCIMSKTDDLIHKGIIFVKLAASALRQQNAIAFYSEGAVFEPKFYIDAAEFMKSGELPIINWVWFGLYGDEEKAGVYTYGLRRFAKEEIEIYVERNKADLNEIRNFLANIVDYILSEDVTLRNGETIGFTAEQKIPITLSPGIAVDGNTLKFAYFE